LPILTAAQSGNQAGDRQSPDKCRVPSTSGMMRIRLGDPTTVRSSQLAIFGFLVEVGMKQCANKECCGPQPDFAPSLELCGHGPVIVRDRT
jgi:hypothetical protein